MASTVIEPRGPFHLDAAARFLADFPAIEADWDGRALRMAFVADDMASSVGATIRQPVAHRVEVDGPADQIARILSLDVDGRPMIQVAERDPVVARVWNETHQLRPVLFASPYEAAAWSVLSHRIRVGQAARLKRELLVDGAFPVPERLLALAPRPGLNATKVERLHGVARAALDGRLDPAALRTVGAEQALARLREIPGLGPFYATLVYVRAVGDPDHLPLGVTPLRAAVAAAYALPEPPDDERLIALAEAWRPLRSWVTLLLRAG